MNLMKSINRLTQIINENDEPVKLNSEALSKLFLYAPKNLNGFEHSERIGLTLSLYGQNDRSQQLLKISRSIPKEYSNILLLILLVSDIKTLILSKGPKRDPIGKPIQSILSTVPTLINYGQRSAPSAIAQVNFQEKVIEEEMTFEKYIKLRFADIRSNEAKFLDHSVTSRFIQQLLCGCHTDFTDIVNNQIVQTSEVRFEYHTYSSTKCLLKKFIEIGNTRINLMHLLRSDSISYEIRRHLTKFDSYVAILNENSPAALLTKIRPFHQVFQWLTRLLSLPTFSDLHSELIRSSQTNFKRDLSMKLWSAAFQEYARPFYSFSFLSDVDEVPESLFQSVFEPIKFDCIASGNFLRLLRSAVPSHPIFDLADDYMERFLKLENCLNEYKITCEEKIKEIEKEWIKYHKDNHDQKLHDFEEEKYAIRDRLHQEEMIMLLKMKEDEKDKQEKLEQLQKEIDEFEELRREKEAEEKIENKKYVDNLVANNAVTPIFRPMTEEEQLMIEKEKLDLFMDFRSKMIELGASEEKILSFFPDLNLPENELEALGIKYEEESENEEKSEVIFEEKSEVKYEEIDELMNSKSQKEEVPVFEEEEEEIEEHVRNENEAIVVSEQIQEEMHNLSNLNLVLDEEEEEEESDEIKIPDFLNEKTHSSQDINGNRFFHRNQNDNRQINRRNRNHNNVQFDLRNQNENNNRQNIQRDQNENNRQINQRDQNGNNNRQNIQRDQNDNNDNEQFNQRDLNDSNDEQDQDNNNRQINHNDGGEQGNSQNDENAQSGEPRSKMISVPLKSISALYNRLVVPSFKTQYRLVSVALFSILKTRNQFQKQIIALSKIFLISSSSQSCEFLNYFTDIPYGPSSFIRIGKTFANSANELGFDGLVQMGTASEPPKSVTDLITRINETPIVVRPDPIFNILLPSGIIQCYISMFRILLMLKLTRAAVDRMWFLSRDSYVKRIALRSSNLMLRFVICTETYFHATALAPAVKDLEHICDDVETIEECNKKHENALRLLLARCLLLPNTKAIRTPLLLSLVEICKYVYEPFLSGEKVPPDEFEECSGKFALILHELNSAVSENQMFRFLDTLFSDFLVK